MTEQSTHTKTNNSSPLIKAIVIWNTIFDLIGKYEVKNGDFKIEDIYQSVYSPNSDIMLIKCSHKGEALYFVGSATTLESDDVRKFLAEHYQLKKKA